MFVLENGVFGMENKQRINTISEMSGSAVGAAVGSEIGSAVAGPIGAIAGSVAGNIIEKVFVWAGNEISTRLLSRQEEKRIVNVMDLAKKKIESNLANDKKLRDDDFFDQISDRSTAEEILEGTLLVAQKEYEERKLQYIANLYANIAFNKDISREIADRLIKISSELTYRQLMIMSAVGFSQIAGIQRKKEAYKVVQGLNNVSIASEIFDLYRKSLIFSSEVILDAGGINPSKLTLGGYGALLYNLMELPRIPFSDTCMIDALKFLGILVPNTQ